MELEPRLHRFQVGYRHGQVVDLGEHVEASGRADRAEADGLGRAGDAAARLQPIA